MKKAKFEIYTEIPGGECWTVINPEHHIQFGDELSIYLKAQEDSQSMAVEFGFDKSQGPYVKLWGPQPHGPGTYAGRFYVNELLALKKLAGEI